MNLNDVNDYKIAKATLDLFPIDIDLAEAQCKRQILTATSHKAKVGDLVVFLGGVNIGKQIAVVKVETNVIYLSAPTTGIPAVGERFLILRPAIVKKAFVNVAASQTDSVVVAAVAATILRTVKVTLLAGGTATDITFNSKGSGVGVAISPLWANDTRSGFGLEKLVDGYWDTVAGEALTCTTGAGSSTGILVHYAEL